MIRPLDYSTIAAATLDVASWLLALCGVALVLLLIVGNY